MTTTHAWGTWDDTKPRVRLMLKALREGGLLSASSHADVWGGVVDKSQLRDPRAIVRTLATWASSYARLVGDLVTQRDADAVFVGYLGQLDVLVAWPLAKLRGQPIVWDAFISLYDTVVDDRKLVSKDSVIAKALWAWEWLACRAADVVVLDTEAHAAWFRTTFDLPKDKTGVVFVGAEGDVFERAADNDNDSADVDDDGPVTALFYGQFIPLHGIETIVEAARRSDPAKVKWVLVGSGQETKKIQAMLDAQPVPHLTWIPWVEYDALRAQIAAADVCLGIFGASDKAGRVIPNKVFQILAVGKPLITRDSAGIRELLSDDDAGVWLVPAADPDAINAAIDAFRAARPTLPKQLHERVVARFSSSSLAAALRDVITSAVERSR